MCTVCICLGLFDFVATVPQLVALLPALEIILALFAGKGTVEITLGTGAPNAGIAEKDHHLPADFFERDVLHLLAIVTQGAVVVETGGSARVTHPTVEPESRIRIPSFNCSNTNSACQRGLPVIPRGRNASD